VFQQVYDYFIGPYISFIFVIGCSPDILKITKIRTVFKKHAVFYGVLFSVLKIF